MNDDTDSTTYLHVSVTIDMYEIVDSYHTILSFFFSFLFFSSFFQEKRKVIYKSVDKSLYDQLVCVWLFFQ